MLKNHVNSECLLIPTKFIPGIGDAYYEGMDMMDKKNEVNKTLNKVYDTKAEPEVIEEHNEIANLFREVIAELK